MDTLTEDLARLKACEGATEGMDDATRDLHMKQVATLRQEINAKQGQIDDLKE